MLPAEAKLARLSVCCVQLYVENMPTPTSGYRAISTSPKVVWNTIRSSPSLGPAMAASASQRKRFWLNIISRLIGICHICPDVLQILLLADGFKLWMAELPWRQASTVGRSAIGSTYMQRKLNDSFYEHMRMTAQAKRWTSRRSESAQNAQIASPSSKLPPK